MPVGPPIVQAAGLAQGAGVGGGGLLMPSLASDLQGLSINDKSQGVTVSPEQCRSAYLILS